MIFWTKIISLLAVLTILLAYTLKQKKTWHVSLMVSAFIIDLGLVLFLEYSRHVIPKTTLTGHPLLTVHVLVAACTLTLYLIQIGLGIFQRMKPKLLSAHKQSGLIFMGCRMATFVTSLWVDRVIH